MNNHRLRTFGLRIVCVFFVSVAVILLLHVRSVYRRGYVGGGFIRNYIPAPLIASTSVDLTVNSFYIAGVTRDSIYLGNHTTPLLFKVFDWKLRDGRLRRVQLRPSAVLPKGSVRLIVASSSSYYVLNGEVGSIYFGALGSSVATRIGTDSVYFKDAIAVDSTSFILKSESAMTHKDVLIKQMDKKILVDSIILERQLDGVFCVDGMLHYARELDRMVYVYFYRNQYIIADKHLSNIQRFRTIDTTSRARIEVATIASNETRTLSAPPMVVNRRSSVSGDWLFIQSGVVGDDEDPNDLNYYAIIDVYNLVNHQYKFSFYLPFERGHQLTSFLVLGNRIAAIYGPHMFSYEIRTDVIAAPNEE